MNKIRRSFRNIHCNREKPPRWFDYTIIDGQRILEHKDGNSMDSMTLVQFVDTFNSMCGEKVIILNK